LEGFFRTINHYTNHLLPAQIGTEWRKVVPLLEGEDEYEALDKVERLEAYQVRAGAGEGEGGVGGGLGDEQKKVMGYGLGGGKSGGLGGPDGWSGKTKALESTTGLTMQCNAMCAGLE
jgi:hypothetical protein